MEVSSKILCDEISPLVLNDKNVYVFVFDRVRIGQRIWIHSMPEKNETVG